MAFQAGAASVDITPPVGTPLAGFAARDHGAEGIHDPLHARALVLDDGRTKLCLITTDLLSIPVDLVPAIRAQIAAATGLPTANVMLNSSHTHSGPVLRGTPLAEVTGRQIAGCAIMAAGRLQPARLGAARGPVQPGINRREWREGQIVLGRNPEGPVAPWVDVLRVDTAEGAPLALLMAHACHPVTRAANSYAISADYPGVAQALVERVHPGVTPLFAQGCSGNINSEPVGGSWEDVRRLGTMVAGEALKVRELAVAEDETPLRVAHELVLLPHQPIPALEQCEQQWAEYEAKATAAATETEANVQRAFARTWRKLTDLKHQGEELPPLEFPLQGFALGDVAVLGLPGEVFVQYCLHAEAVSPFRQTLTLGCTNGSLAYIPTAEALSEGGYEVAFAPIWFGRLPFAPELEANLKDGITRLLARLAVGRNAPSDR